MPEETAAASSSESMEEKPCSSSAAVADGSVDVMAEAKKLIGAGNRHLVMGDVVSAVNVFQEACSMLAERYGDTADECGEAFFLCGKSLLELARMENTVLGDALEGVPEESSEEGEKRENSKFENADNLDEQTRDELRMQVYDAMAEKEISNGEDGKTEPKEEAKEEDMATAAKEEDMATAAKEEDMATAAKEEDMATAAKEEDMATAAKEEDMATAAKEEDMATAAKEEDMATAAKEEDMATAAKEEDMATAAKEEDMATAAKEEDMATAAKEEAMATAAKEEGAATSPVKNGHEHLESPVNGVEETPVEEAGKENDVKMSEEQNGKGDEAEEKMEAEGEDDDDDDDEDDEGEGTAEDKESDEEVGNLQLAWEMLEVAKVIYKRKENKADQLMAAQAYLKLGEVGAESGNYPAAVEDFQDCLALQLKHLPPHSRLLAETHYQLGMTYCYTGQYSQAIQHYSCSVKVIEGRLAMLQEVIDKGEDGAKEDKTELEELKQLLPDIAEKVEDAKESQRTAGSASVAIQQTLAGASTSSALAENSGSSSAFEASQLSVRSAADGASSKSASDISHLVRKKRKMEASPIKDTDAKKTKQETVNGSGDSSSGSNGNEVPDKGEQEPAKPSSAGSSA